MEIFIQGRKDGYNVLYPKPTPATFYSFAYDIQSISANNNDIYWGGNFYTLAFTENGCIYTKYIIGDDVKRGQLGEIGISILIPTSRKLSGPDVKSLLDELVDLYVQLYIKDNKIVEPSTGFDWSLFSSLAKKYDEKVISNNTENQILASGTKDPALCYYSTESNLIEYFDKPFQEEYEPYRQILFISSNLRGISDPKNVLKNSGDEVNPDLKNEYYYLTNCMYISGLSIMANGKPRTDKKGENLIRAKWLVEIKYSKDDCCYDPIIVSGEIADINSDIHNYLNISRDQIRIKNEKLKPNPKKIKVEFKVTDRKGLIINDAEIACTNKIYFSEKIASNNSIDFSGEDLKIPWTAKVSKDDFIGTKDFVPIKNVCVEILIERRKTITIVVTDGHRIIGDFKVWTKLTNGFQQTNKIEFVDEEINHPHTITVYKDGYFEEKIENYRPSIDDDNLIIVLRKKPESIETPSVPGRETPSDKGKSFLSKRKTFVSKPKFRALIIYSAFTIIAGILLIWFLLSRNKPDEVKFLTETQINNYIGGDSLILEKLYSFKNIWEAQGGDNQVLKNLELAIDKRKIIDSKQFGKLEYNEFKRTEKHQTFINAIHKLDWDSTESKEIITHLGNISSLTLTQIVDSINAKRALKSKDNLELLTQDLIENHIDEERKRLFQLEHDIKNYLITSSDFDRKTITQYYRTKGLSKKLNTSIGLIHDFITSGYVDCNSFKKKVLDDRFLKINTNLKDWIEKVCKDGQSISSTDIAGSNQVNNNSKTTEIIEYLKGSELDKNKLKQFQEVVGTNQKLKNSIQLCIDFWDLDGSTSGTKEKTYYSFQKKLKSDSFLINSKLRVCVDKMCQDSANVSYREIDKKRGLD